MEPINKRKYTSETECKYEQSDVYLVPLIINKESVLDDLERILQMFGGDFISYKVATDCSCEIGRLSDTVEVLLKKKPEEGKEIVLAMIDRILHVQTDDDWFPIDVLQVLYEMIGIRKSPEEIFEEWEVYME